VILGHLNSGYLFFYLFTFFFFSFVTFVSGLLCSLGVFFGPFWTHTEEGSWEQFVCPLSPSCVTRSDYHCEQAARGEQTSYACWGFVVSVAVCPLFYIQICLSEQPGKARWVPTGTAGVFLRQNQDPGSSCSGLAPGLCCLSRWSGGTRKLRWTGTSKYSSTM